MPDYNYNMQIVKTTNELYKISLEPFPAHSSARSNKITISATVAKVDNYTVNYNQNANLPSRVIISEVTKIPRQLSHSS